MAGEIVALQSQTYSSYASIGRVAVPAVLLNVAQPVTVTVQTALLGKYGSESQAAFAAVDTTCHIATCLFNFLVDGVSAKCGQSVGQGNWKALQTRVRLALASSAVFGAVAFGVLAALRHPVFHVLSLSPAVSAVASPYWWIRLACVPLVLFNMAVNGILQGYNRMAINATISTGQSLLELLVSVIVLMRGGGLTAMGFVTFATSGLAAIIGMVCMAFVTPLEAPAVSDAMAMPLLQDDVLQHPPRQEVQGAKDADGSEDDVSQGSPLGVVMHDLTDFLRDGGNMLVRSALLQATFFLALAVAGQLGTAQLAAHQIVAQLWLLTSYIVDGVANAGTVLGSRLAAQTAADPDSIAAWSLKRLIWRCLMIGVAIGVASGLAMYFGQTTVIHTFTSDAGTESVLRSPLWLIVSSVQPINAVVFVYDGLLYACHAFAWTRSVMLSGFLVAFLPMLAAAYWGVHALWAVWFAKFLLNVWRLFGAAYRIHFQPVVPSIDTTHMQNETP